MQRKTPASGTASGQSEQQSGPTTMRNSGEIGRDRPAPQGSRERHEQRQEPRSNRTSLDGIVNESSDESFPASDAPSWSPTTAGSPCPDPPCDDDECVSKD